MDVKVAKNGSGTVAVTVLLDKDAAGRVPNLGSQLRVDDLRSAGWTVTGPTPESDGGARVVASAKFGQPSQLTGLLEQLAGTGGPLQAALTKRHSFGKDKFQFTGTLNLSGGVNAFSDQALSQRLRGQALGQLAAGQPPTLTAPSQVRVNVDLPGGASGSTKPAADGGFHWSATLGAGPAPMRAASQLSSGSAKFFTVIAVIAAVGFVLTLGFAVATRGSRTASPRRPL